MKAIILHRVRPALLASAQWYELQRAGLGGEFLAAVEVAVIAIKNGPFRFPAVYRAARRAQLERFPFGVFFVIRSDAIYIFAVSHLHGNPRKWQRFVPK
jgi:toxin ParE1/3/4